MFDLFQFPYIFITLLSVWVWWVLTARICCRTAIAAHLEPVRRANRDANIKIKVYLETIPYLLSYFDARDQDITGQEVVNIVKALTIPDYPLVIRLANDDEDKEVYIADNDKVIKDFLAVFDDSDTEYQVAEIATTRPDMSTVPIKIYPNVKEVKMWTETNDKYIVKQIEAEQKRVSKGFAVGLLVIAFLADLFMASGAEYVMLATMLGITLWLKKQTLDGVRSNRCPTCHAPYTRGVEDSWDENVDTDYQTQNEYDEYGRLSGVNLVKYVEYDTVKKIKCHNCGEMVQTTTHHYHQA